MGDDIGWGLSSMAVCFDFRSTNIVQLSNRNPYFFRFWCHHPLITQLTCESVETFWFKCDFPKYLAPLLFGLCPSIPKSIYKKKSSLPTFPCSPYKLLIPNTLLHHPFHQGNIDLPNLYELGSPNAYSARWYNLGPYNCFEISQKNLIPYCITD